MPARPLPTGFAEALGSVQRVRAAKRAQQREATPPEALSGADTEKARENGSERRREDRKQEQQSRQAVRERQRRPEQNWALVREGEKEAERRREKQANLERSRRRDKEAAAAAQAEARRQAEEETAASRRRELEELQADVERFKRQAEDAEKQRLAEVEARRRDKLEAAAAAQAEARQQAEEEAAASRRRELEELQADVERFKRQAQGAEKQRLAEVETRRRDKEAAAAAQAEARRQAEEEAAAVTETDDEHDAASDELEPESPSACAPLAVNVQARKEQSPIDEALSKLEELHRKREQSPIDEALSKLAGLRIDKALSKLADLRTKKEAAPRERRPGVASKDLLLELAPRTVGAEECLEDVSEQGGEDQKEAPEDQPEEGAVLDVLEEEAADWAAEGLEEVSADGEGKYLESGPRGDLFQPPSPRDRPPSPSRELYLDTLVESEDTAGCGNSLVHHRLVPLQSPETIRCALASVYVLASTCAQKL